MQFSENNALVASARLPDGKASQPALWAKATKTGTFYQQHLWLPLTAFAALSVMLIDVDHFKSVNDTRGHQAGDEVLRQVAEAITENVRPSDFVFRYGGEEFLVVLVETRMDQAMAIAERVRAALQGREIKAGGLETFGVTASIGDWPPNSS